MQNKNSKVTTYTGNTAKQQAVNLALKNYTHNRTKNPTQASKSLARAKKYLKGGLTNAK